MKSDLHDFDDVLASTWSEYSEARLSGDRDLLERSLEPGVVLPALHSLADFEDPASGLRSFRVTRESDWSIVARIGPGSSDLSWLQAGREASDALRGVIVTPDEFEGGVPRAKSLHPLAYYVDAFGGVAETGPYSVPSAECIVLEDPVSRSVVERTDCPPLSSGDGTVDGRYLGEWDSSIAEVACMTAAAAEYLLHQEQHATLRVLMPCDGELPVTIARVRAARVLLRRVARAFEHSFDRIHVWGLAGGRCQCPDRPTHQIRLTTACVAAVIGSCDVIVAEPFPELPRSTANSQRLAVNTLRILRHESHLGFVNDAFGGSYYLEALTGQIVDGAWDTFLAIEDEGGLAKIASSSTLTDILKTRIDGAGPNED